MLLALIPLNIMADTTETEKARRQVYLHAFDNSVAIADTKDSATIFKGDDLNLYLAVDKPNKANLGSSETDPEEYQYNLTGLTVRIYYNTRFFDLAEGTDINSPIDYRVENATNWEDDEIEDNLPNGTPGLDHTNPGYQVNEAGYDLNGIWASAYVTVFYAGAFLPDGPEGYWYNLCKLPLKAKEAGTTSVYIEIGGNDNKHTLELFAKNNPNLPSDDTDNLIKNFNYTAINGGYFNLFIEDADRPEVTATPAPGKYVGGLEVELSSNFDCDIYYTTDGNTIPAYDIDGRPIGATHLYMGNPISVTDDTLIKAIAVRKKDGMEGLVRDFRYEIVPPMPMLFDENGDLLPDEYYQDWTESGYNVYASDNITIDNKIANITDGSTVFYTFNQGLSSSLLERGIEDNDNIGESADTQWKPVITASKLVNDAIKQSRVIRLVTVDKNEKVSDVNTYKLGLIPSGVTATPEWGLVYTDEITVELDCETPGAKIYYTLNGGDPRTGGAIEYDPSKGIPLSEDTTITAASCYDGVWSKDYYVFPYTFTDDGDGIKAFYPGGEYEGSVPVSLIPDEVGREIAYKVNDGEEKIYTEPEDIDEDAVIEAWYTDDPDTKYTFEYTIIPLPPVFAPESTQFTAPENVAVFAPESNAENTAEYTLKYTLDGSDPIENGIEGDPTFDEANILVTGYTVISAVVIRNGRPSRVVTHTYDVVYDRPAAPTPTLTPGYYTREIGGEGFETEFDQVPEGTRIYYTIGGDGYFDDPDPDNVGNGTYEYDGTPIEVTGKTTIKAIAVSLVNGVDLISDVGVYSYTITPEAPVAAPSGVVDGTVLPVIPVDAICGEGAIVKYSINGGTFVEFENADAERFYIDTATGNAYRDEACTEPLYEMDGAFEDSVKIQFKSELDGVESAVSSYVYETGGADSELMPPFADKPSGIYDENKNGFDVSLYSIYGEGDGVQIEYCTNNDQTWREYDGTALNLTTIDTILYARTRKGDKVSDAASYAYAFVPPAPIIVPPSGIYPIDTTESVEILFPDTLPDGNYRLYYLRSDSLDSWGISRNNVEFSLRESVSVKAYIKNETTGRISENAKEFYIIEDANIAAGAVWIKDPYNVNELSVHLLSTGEYAKGIMLERMGTGAIRYQYRYKPVGSDAWTAWTNVATFDELSPIMPTGLMDEIEITAWISGDEQNTKMTHKIDFLHLGVPDLRLEGKPNADGNYAKGTKYYVQNEHYDNPNVVVYYTTDGTDPITSSTRKSFSGTPEGEEEKLSKKTTVKTVYFYSCGGCEACMSGEPENCVNTKAQNFYGDVGEYTFAVRTVDISSGGSSGGSASVINERKYTIDIFGIEHPTHIGYINGYPDGSVQPDGFITREEVAAILYRIMTHKYEKPFTTTGEVFPDVELGRWSVTEIEYMADNDVIYGYPDGEFRPTQNLTRAEFAALIFRFTGIEQAELENPFTDLDESHWAYNEVLALVNTGLVEGYEDSSFKPENNITRAETMTVINKLLGRRPVDSYVKSLGFNPFNDLEIDKWYYTTVLEATITHDYWLNSDGDEKEWENWK